MNKGFVYVYNVLSVYLAFAAIFGTTYLGDYDNFCSVWFVNNSNVLRGAYKSPNQPVYVAIKDRCRFGRI